MQQPPRIRGVLAPVVTPFKRDLSPDPERFITHCRWLLGQNCGLAVFGTNSEANSLSVDERMVLLETLVSAGLDPRRMMPGTGCCALTDAVRLSEHAVKAGCAGVLMLPPFYYKDVTDDGLYRHFAEVIAGMKDSSGDWGHTKTMLDAFAASGFDVFPGSEAFLLAGMRHGAAGCISATANVNPAAIDRLYREWRSVDADQQQDALNTVRKTVGRYVMIPALKQVIAHYANDPEWVTVRPPFTELTAAQSQQLIEGLQQLGFNMPGIGRAAAKSVV